MKKTSILLAIICMLSINAFGDEIDDLLPAIIQVESGGNPHAMSDAGAIGICQIMPIVLVEYKREHPSYEGHNYISSEDLFKPEINKEIAKWYLRKIKNHYLKGQYTTERMLASYNGGPTRMRKLLRQGKDWEDMPRESVKYVNKILARI